MCQADQRDGVSVARSPDHILVLADQNAMLQGSSAAAWQAKQWPYQPALQHQRGSQRQTWVYLRGRLEPISPELSEWPAFQKCPHRAPLIPLQTSNQALLLLLLLAPWLASYRQQSVVHQGR